MKKKIISATMIMSLVSLLFVNFSFATNITNESFNNSLVSEGFAVEVLDIATGETEIQMIPSSQSTLSFRDRILNNNVQSLSPYFPSNISETYNQVMPTQIVGGEDNRVKVYQVTQAPYSAVCKLYVNLSNNTTSQGTAFLVGDNIAVTAAHCFDRNDGVSINSIELVPGKFNGIEPFGRATVATRIIPTAYNTDEANYDWAIMILNSNIGNECGWFGVTRYGSYTSYLNTQVTLTGYPEEDLECPYRHSGPVSSGTNYSLHYEVDTSRGQSGSPVYVGSGDACYALGVHRGAYGNINRGCWFYSQFWDTLMSAINNN